MLRTILQGRCPRCRAGKMFKKGLDAYPFLGAMYPNCSVCHLHYEIEPGFFTGAMYIGYAFSVAIVTACGVAVFVLGANPASWVYIVTTVGATLLFAPLNFRASRVLMLHLFGGVAYNPALGPKA
jgi:uncharacterized protein (DUF983 family)